MLKWFLFLICSASCLCANVDRAPPLPPLENVPFVFVDLALSSQEKHILQTLDIGQQQTFNFYGSPAHMQEALKAFVATIGANSDEAISTVTCVIARISFAIVQALDTQAAWVTVRATLANNAFNTPRWHQDGYYFAPFTGGPCKFAAVLKGPSTLFYRLPEELHLEFQDHFQDREYLSRMLDPAFVETVPEGMGALFIVGDAARAAVHSEPPMQQSRLFFSILPGSPEQIEALRRSRATP